MTGGEREAGQWGKEREESSQGTPIKDPWTAEWGLTEGEVG